jgi:SP family facilitated glucose transporter-like MFS transporter 8
MQSFVQLGALISCPIAGFLSEKVGRKRTMLILSVPFVVGWMMVGLATTLSTLEIGRFITGSTWTGYKTLKLAGSLI